MRRRQIDYMAVVDHVVMIKQGESMQTYTQGTPYTDTSSSINAALHNIIEEWVDLRRKGKLIVHFDGNGPKKIQFDYFVDI